MFFHYTTYASFMGLSPMNTLKVLSENGWEVPISEFAVPTKPKVLIITNGARTYTELNTNTMWIQSDGPSAHVVDLMIRGLYTSVLLYKAGNHGFSGASIAQFWMGEIDPPRRYPFCSPFAKSLEWFEGAESALGISIPTHSIGDQFWMTSKTECVDDGTREPRQVISDALLEDHGIIVCPNTKRCEEIGALFPPMKITMEMGSKLPSIRWYDSKAIKFHENWCL